VKVYWGVYHIVFFLWKIHPIVSLVTRGQMNGRE